MFLSDSTVIVSEGLVELMAQVCQAQAQLCHQAPTQDVYGLKVETSEFPLDDATHNA